MDRNPDSQPPESSPTPGEPASEDAAADSPAGRAPPTQAAPGQAPPAEPATASDSSGPLADPNELLDDYPWLTFLLPLAVYMLLGSLEPSADAEPGEWLSYDLYPLMYTLKLGCTLAAMLFVLPGYARWPLKVSPLSVVVGVVGVVVWIGLCKLRIEQNVLPAIGLGWLVDTGERPAFNPLEQLADTPTWAYTFLAIRFVGLAAAVPVIEEFAYRGFFYRFFSGDRWQEVPFGVWHPLAAAITTGVFVAAHPAEILAAIAWFSLVTWLMVRTKSLWDCVVAHAVTNLLLGVYVVVSGDWFLM